jgi:SNF2 family DNA or RNA helicase
LIARDTVEEKVLELQEKKRDIAGSIVSTENGGISGLTRERLDLLLS